MKGIEKQILNIIKEQEEVDKESVAFKLGISTEYAARICSILARDGYIEKKPNGKFKISLKGEKFTARPVSTRKPFVKF
ncbi:MAG: MarR family transcriptional regulator [Candidatus Aminicenantes bacterium]|nr:MarR family transcriptional regulator [Candidatus Aminicenantes bacterium]